MTPDPSLMSNHFWEIFEQSIRDYHIKDHVDQEFSNPYEGKGLDSLMYEKNWVDTVQWHFEDLVRDPKASDKDIAELKRRIDRQNQIRTDFVEKMDDWIIDHFKSVETKAVARLNTESPAWVIDRLSILALKIYHMKEQVDRDDVDENHRSKCQMKLDVLLEQKADLCRSFDDLMVEVGRGEVRVKVYRQMKMYNDEKLNPVLYKGETKN